MLHKNCSVNVCVCMTAFRTVLCNCSDISGFGFKSIFFSSKDSLFVYRCI